MRACSKNGCGACSAATYPSSTRTHTHTHTHTHTFPNHKEAFQPPPPKPHTPPAEKSARTIFQLRTKPNSSASWHDKPVGTHDAPADPIYTPTVHTTTKRPTPSEHVRLQRQPPYLRRYSALMFLRPQQQIRHVACNGTQDTQTGSAGVPGVHGPRVFQNVPPNAAMLSWSQEVPHAPPQKLFTSKKQPVHCCGQRRSARQQYGCPADPATVSIAT
jgi:hypothetical protein